MAAPRQHGALELHDLVADGAVRIRRRIRLIRTGGVVGLDPAEEVRKLAASISEVVQLQDEGVCGLGNVVVEDSGQHVRGADLGVHQRVFHGVAEEELHGRLRHSKVVEL